MRQHGLHSTVDCFAVDDDRLPGHDRVQLSARDMPADWAGSQDLALEKPLCRLLGFACCIAGVYQYSQPKIVHWRMHAKMFCAVGT